MTQTASMAEAEDNMASAGHMLEVSVTSLRTAAVNQPGYGRIDGSAPAPPSPDRRTGVEPMSESPTVPTAPPPDKRMKLRYAGTCRLCGTDLPAKHEAIYERATKTVRCVSCPDESGSAGITDDVAEPDIAPPVATDAPVVEPLMVQEAAAAPEEEVDSGTAGSSARREYERRMAKRDARVRAEHPLIGGALLKVFGPGQSTKAWDQGALGEEILGAKLHDLTERGIALLHDRRIPRSKANIDHMAVTPAGVWVIDAKRYKGRPDLKIEGGILSPRVEKLTVGGRDRTKLVDGVLKQMDLVRAVVGDLPVFGALCFIEADWPLIAGTFRTRGVHVLMPRKLRKLLTEQTGEVDVAATHRALATHFPPA